MPNPRFRLVRLEAVGGSGAAVPGYGFRRRPASLRSWQRDAARRRWNFDNEPHSELWIGPP